MKLFTKDIDKKLFAQYPKGNNLEQQQVVAKIFNPYGRGTWYIINSDPSDPDYLWAIVDLFEVEVGSVSRNELESIKVPPFGLHLERDMSFTPTNAASLLEGLEQGKMYEKGGETGYSNKAMLENIAETMEHHIKEFEAALKKTDGEVMAWVLTKAQRASTDLADITHYLESQNEIKREEVEGEEDEYANGGEVKWAEADYGDSALVVSENKMGIIIKPYGRKFHLKFVDGTEKTYDASELKFFKDIDEFDLGGQMIDFQKQRDLVRAKIAVTIGIDKAIKYLDRDYVVSPFHLIESAVRKGFITIDEIDENLWQSALGESSEIEESYRDSEEGIGSSDMNAFISSMLNDAGIRVGVVNDRYERLDKDGNKMAGGGDTASPNSEFMKWFVDWSKSVNKYVYISMTIPNEFSSPIKDGKDKIVLLDVIEKKGDNDAKKYFNEILKKADEFGVSIYLQPIPRTNNLKSQEHKNKITKDYLIKYYEKFGFENTDGGFMVRAPKMAGGGKVKFKDKVEAIKASLLKRKKVPAKVQKDYGKTFSPAEAEDSAKRIVGAMTAKERLAMRLKKKKRK